MMTRARPGGKGARRVSRRGRRPTSGGPRGHTRRGGRRTTAPLGPTHRPSSGCTLSATAMAERPDPPFTDPPAHRPQSLGVAGQRAARPTIVIGVLGGIASGKSYVARRLAGPDGVVVAADDLAHAALAAPGVRAEVVQAFGAGVVGADGAIDRAALAAIVFRDPGARRRLEGWIHPWVRARISSALEEARAEGRPRVVLDVPLLLENDAQHGLVRVCDHLVFVEVGAAERERRARETRGWGPGELARREAAQLPLAEKRRRASVVVRNEGSLAELDVAIDAALTELGLGP